MREPRVNQSSIRFSDKVSLIINSCEGQTFSDRFENCVLSYVDDKIQRENYISYLDKSIEEKRIQLTALQNDICKYSSILNSLKDLFNKCNTI